MSAFPPKADIVERDRHVRFVPEADMGTAYLITSSALASNFSCLFARRVAAGCGIATSSTRRHGPAMARRPGR
jgi:hypothetical protein